MTLLNMFRSSFGYMSIQKTMQKYENNVIYQQFGELSISFGDMNLS